jgi:inner membrane protein
MYGRALFGFHRINPACPVAPDRATLPPMHVPTHLLSGWCLANCLPLTARERFLAMAAAALPDLDGLGILFGERTYQDYHHLLGHNLPFCLLIAGALSAFSTRRRIVPLFVLYLSLAHLHLLLDYFGSGPLWKIYYLWPFLHQGYRTDLAWEFFSWQNILAASLLLVWTILIAIRQRRTPLEWAMPSLDRQLIPTSKVVEDVPTV